MREAEEDTATAYVTEPGKQVPIAHHMDVVVAGAGVSGVFAAIAAARNGTRTAIVDRFGSVGGNIGPGMIVNGNMVSGQPHPGVGYESTVYPGLYGIGKEFVQRYGALGGGLIPPYSQPPNNFAGDASIASYVAQKMLEESGVTLMLSTQVADPILDGNRVVGLFVEDKSGRRAVTARVVIDATGDADVARRAGAPVLYPNADDHEMDGHAPTGMGTYFLVGGVDWDRYTAFADAADPDEDDVRWGQATYGEKRTRANRHMWPALRRAHESGEFHLTSTVALGGATIEIAASFAGKIGSGGVVQGRAHPDRIHEELDAGNADHVSILEAAIRKRIFEVWHFWKTHAPGFEHSSLLCIAPFLGSRGGPCIEGDVTLTMDDCRAGRRFDDVTYLYGEFRALRYTCAQGQPLWTDVPYRVMLPKGIDGMLAVGRSASGKPDTLLRNRMAVKVMGQAGGIAAAMAARKGIVPRDLDIGELQGALLDAGFHLGDRNRLRELGLS